MITFLDNNSDAFTSLGVLLTFLVGIATLIVSVYGNREAFYIETVTQGRVKWIESMRSLMAKYICLVNTNYHSNMTEILSGEKYNDILQTTMEIQLMLDSRNKEYVKIGLLMDSINGDYEYLLNVCACIEDHMSSLVQRRINQEIAQSPFFISYLMKKAEEKNIEIMDKENYINDVNASIDLFLEVNKTQEDVEMFIDGLLDEPVIVIARMQNQIKELKIMVQRCLNSEQDRVSKESLGRKTKNN